MSTIFQKIAHAQVCPQCSIVECVSKHGDRFKDVRLSPFCRAELEKETPPPISQDECDHEDIDERECLDCGKDLTEEMMAQAYDRAKDFRKYGDT